MELKDKLLHLRALEGARRGLGRAMTQTEVAMAMRTELGASVSQAYLSQLERGKRTHLSNTSREALARFFGVHPGYLVNDPVAGARGSRRDVDSAPQAATPAVPSGPYGWYGPRGPHGIPGFEQVPGMPGMPPAMPSNRQAADLFPLAPASSHGRETEYASWLVGNQATPGLPPGTRLSGDSRLDSVLSRLRDHPDPGRVLLLLDQLLRLSEEQMAALNTAIGPLLKQMEEQRSR